MKDEVLKVAQRHQVKTYIVSDGGIRPYQDPLIELVIVAQGADAADDWIADEIGAGDIAITSDIPLADRCVKAGALVLKPNGEVLDEKKIGAAVATRNLMTGLREAGEITGGPRSFSKQDRSRFSNALEVAVQRAKGSTKTTSPPPLTGED